MKKEELLILWYLIVHKALLPYCILLMQGQGVWLGEICDSQSSQDEENLGISLIKVYSCDEEWLGLSI